MTQAVPLLAWMLGALLLAAAAIWVAWRWRERAVTRLGFAPLAERSQGLALLLAAAMALSPLWLLLVWQTATAALALSAQPLLVLPPGAQAARTAAMAGSVASLLALLAAPLLVLRLAMSDRRAALDAARQATEADVYFAERFATAIAQLGSTRRVTRRSFSPSYQQMPGGRLRRDAAGAPMPELDAEGRMIGEWRIHEEVVPDIEARIGALFALERISLASLGDHVAVMETIAAYVRENSGIRAESDAGTGRNGVRPDIQMAMQILGRRDIERRTHEAAQTPPFRLDLRGVDLAGADMLGLALGPARLGRADLSGAWLDGADLSGADLEAAVLAGAWMERTRFIGAQLRDTDLTDAWLVHANLTSACLAGADLAGARLDHARLCGAELDACLPRDTDVAKADFTLAWLRGVDCSGFVNLEQHQLEDAFGDSTTELADSHSPPLHWPRDPVDYMTAFRLWSESVARGGAPRVEPA